MSYKRNFPNQHVFERYDKLELVKLTQEKEKEGFEMVKPIFPKERHFYEADGRTKWIAVMKKGRKSK